MSAPLLAMHDIRKRFGGVQALNGVNLEVRSGEVHALVGENGAGKSTLMHILAGVHQPDEGSISWDGKQHVVIANEHAAQRLGIAIVFQERSLFSSLSVAENIFAGRQPVSRWGAIDRRALRANSAALLRRVGLACDPGTPLSELSSAQQQMVEIAKALSLDAKLIIFDEPTAALTETETTALFSVIAQLKAADVAIIYISHRLEEIFKIGDCVTVLKDGTWQGTFAVAQITTDDLINRMVGRALSFARADGGARYGPVVLEVRNLTDLSLEGEVRTRLRGISFQARKGEVLALAGLCGAGRTELALAIFGARPRESGEILIDGQVVDIDSPADAIAAGIAYLPEDRKDAGLFLDMTIAQNVAAARLKDFGSWWFSDARGEAAAEEFRKQLRVTSHGVKQAVQTLSGGNQQKVVLAKWLLIQPTVLIVDEPTRGIDVGAKAEVHALLRQLARKGTAVIVISSELPEVLALADRILVMREGRITGEFKGEDATEEAIMRYASLHVPA
ncbi:MAG: sugar ABC transporter ATP-binding protein [Verrucomicrobia subdivision 3 bacterium]|nr:sugar ABC transporter ATP-binding protein [Limisphaerales bacterium]